MTGFIQFIGVDGGPFVINLERVDFFRPGPQESTVIYFNDYMNPVRVQESFNEVKKIIDSDSCYLGSDYQEIITCFLCHDDSDSWVWVHDHEMKMKFTVCFECIESRQKTGEITS